MKKLLFVISFLFIGIQINAQSVSGTWNGVLKVQGMKLRLVFHIENKGEKYTATMDSPDQGAKGIPVSSTVVTDSSITFKVKSAMIEYNGVIKGDSIVGDFHQSGFTFPLSLYRGLVSVEKIARPQEPQPPFPYISEEVKIHNIKDSLTLSGTLTIPNMEKKFPAVILISGSGPQNRDEEVMGHKPFLVLSDYLTRHGIAVLRFDDRGTGNSTGNFSGSTSADFADDVRAAIEFLRKDKSINLNKIGLIGHSEGGIIAPMVAADNPQIDFIVLLATPGMRGDKLLLLQQNAIATASGMSSEEIDRMKKLNGDIFKIVLETTNNDSLKEKLKLFLLKELSDSANSDITGGMKKENFIKLQVNSLTSPWMNYFLRYDPIPTLKRVQAKMFILNGSKDLQVPAKENLESIKSALELSGNTNFEIKELPNLNHLFQKCETGLPNEYSQIEETFNPSALSVITEWILKNSK